MSAADVPGLEPLLSEEGWVYASLPPQEPGDPGRYHALFGRDSLITALQVLPAAPEVARATLRALATRQAERLDIEIQAEPGKIGHEFRLHAPEAFAAAGYGPLRDGRFSYYGTADATAWWLVLLDALGDAELIRALEPNWRAAGEWLLNSLRRGRGLIRHGSDAPRGSLTQQGWRDAIDPGGTDGSGFVHEDGAVPAPPIADADTQAATFAGLRALARISGDPAWEERSARLSALIARRYLPDVIAIAGDGRPVRGAGSQLGWLLWSGALDGAARDAAAARLVQPDIFTRYGLRTLSSDHPRFDAYSYHRGSIWPFDSWLGWGGLRAAGREEQAEALRVGVLEALERSPQAPELYAVTRAGRLDRIAMGTRVQAWSVGARYALSARWDGRSWNVPDQPASAR